MPQLCALNYWPSSSTYFPRAEDEAETKRVRIPSMRSVSLSDDEDWERASDDFLSAEVEERRLPGRGNRAERSFAMMHSVIPSRNL